MAHRVAADEDLRDNGKCITASIGQDAVVEDQIHPGVAFM